MDLARAWLKRAAEKIGLVRLPKWARVLAAFLLISGWGCATIAQERPLDRPQVAIYPLPPGMFDPHPLTLPAVLPAAPQMPPQNTHSLAPRARLGVNSSGPGQARNRSRRPLEPPPMNAPSIDAYDQAWRLRDCGTFFQLLMTPADQLMCGMIPWRPMPPPTSSAGAIY
jgi:hypothetical protein